jgi:hypothetical protein
MMSPKATYIRIILVAGASGLLMVVGEGDFNWNRYRAINNTGKSAV